MPPFQLGLSFYLFPFLEGLNVDLSNTQAGKAEGKCLSLLRQTPEGLRKVKASSNVEEIVANRSATIVAIQKRSNLPKI